MKTIAAAFIALGLFAGVANAQPASQIFTDIQNTAPHSLFDQIQDTAPHSVFDQIQESAPLKADTSADVRQDLSGE
ncbi:MAG: hypothetical protein JSS20_05895 [Proteobacteria bacterium]|nr:hypothetical protein [Pseudomonadota bacterium]